MAGKLKTREMSDVLLRLNDVNTLLDSSVAKLLQSQSGLGKAVETQKLLNKSIKPMFAAFVPQEDASDLTSTASQSQRTKV